jgi:predicted metalloprotease with PDZ domain
MISYQVYFRQPELHYVEIEMKISVNNLETIEVYMPVWTPGSYMVREYSKNLDQFQVFDESEKNISFQKNSKNTWSFIPEKEGSYFIHYRIYANEWSVRTNHVDIDHAMLNGAPTFLAVKGCENVNHQIEFHPHENWKVISSSLPEVGNEWTRIAENYDLLVDSPTEIGNHEVLSIEAGNVLHEVALVGKSNIHQLVFIKDLKAIVEQETQFFGTIHPCKRYLFIIHHTENVYGGLEHLNCSLNMVPRWNYEPRDKYLQSMSLLAHEYFHLWNVKRIRPVELGPFDYQQENYTRQLWAIEGVTSFYDDYFLYLSGVSNLSEYLKTVVENINKVENTPGDNFQTLAESSFDAWIKYYRQNENTQNNQVSYYVKGATVVTALNLLILHATNAEKSMNDVMRVLYQKHLQHPEKGYSEEELLEVCETIAGISLKEFFAQHIFGNEPIDYAYYFSLAGLELYNNEENAYQFGWTITNKEGKFLLSKIDINTSAALAGLNAEDEILAINGYRMNAQWEKSLFDKKTGEEIEVIVSRYGIIRNFNIELQSSEKKNYTIHFDKKPSSEQLLVRKAWLR